MRAWPLGLVYFNDRNKLVKAATDQSVLTHRHPMAQAASVAAGVAVALGNCMGKRVSPNDVVNEIIAASSLFNAEEKEYKKNSTKTLTPSSV